ncbi:MAG: SusC/RagA family TonB-linked outer membrane protein [Bacteroidaceae bacterium]|nr:SusC/RagA family TonB-linked outer membrane protein [Bacteroidaceae bacterium]
MAKKHNSNDAKWIKTIGLLFIIFSLFISPLEAQDYVTGRVTDAATGQSLQGVSVSSGPGVSVLTDSVGQYRVPVTSFDGQLRFSSPGYVEGVVSLCGQQQKDFRLFGDAFRSQKNGSGAYDGSPRMSIDEIMDTRYGSDVRTIGRSNVPGVGANMFIRGYQSLHLNTQPLVIIDGVVQSMENVESAFQGFTINPFSNIDINDIEKVEVLKNASSIYGSKGANGAIIITTKRGASTTTKIDLNMNWAIDFKPKQMRMMDAAQYRSYASEILKGHNGNAQANVFEGFLNDESDLTKNISYNTYHNNHDWSNDVYRTAFRQYYGLNVEGGDDVAKYALSASYMMGDNVLKSTDYDRLSTHFNADIILAKNLTVATGLDFTYITRQLLNQGVNAYTSAPYLSLIKSPLLMPYQYTRDGVHYTSKLSGVDDFGVSNPVSIIDNSVSKYTQYRFGVNLLPKWQVNDWLDLSTRLAYNMNAVKEHYYSPIEGIAPEVTADGNIWQNTVKDQSINQGVLFSDTRLHVNKLFDGIHGLDASLGFRIQSNHYKSNYGEGHNTGSDKVVNLSASLEGKSTRGEKTTMSNAALYLQGAYTFNNKYGVWGTVTSEACSTFGNKADGGFKMMNGVWATFPSVGANWLISSERFMANVDFINHLNFRTAYGLTGNDGLDAINRYAYLSAVNYFGVANGLQIGNLDNQTQKWETTRKLNAGIDLSVFNERLSFSVDYFHHKTSDLLMYGQADIITGLSAIMYNGGDLTNRGFEVSIAARPVNRRSVKWNTELGIAHYKNMLTSLPDGTSTYEVADGTFLLKEGLPIGTFYGYRTVANASGSIVFATEAEAQSANLKTWNDNKSKQLTFHAGDIHFDDLDGNNLINENDRTVIGDANPDITGSWANRVTIGRFTLDADFSFSLGGDIYNYQRHMLESMTNYHNQTEAVTSRWKYEGQQTSIPRAVYGDPMKNSRFSDRFIEDGSYLKLREVRLSYNLSLPWHFLRGATVWGSVNDLYTWTNYLGSNPEVTYGTSPLTQGIDYGISPLSRSVQFGIKLNL